MALAFPWNNYSMDVTQEPEERPEVTADLDEIAREMEEIEMRIKVVRAKVNSLRTPLESGQ